MLYIDFNIAEVEIECGNFPLFGHLMVGHTSSQIYSSSYPTWVGIVSTVLHVIYKTVQVVQHHFVSFQVIYIIEYNYIYYY